MLPILIPFVIHFFNFVALLFFLRLDPFVLFGLLV
jgi:hypothetical protein